MSALYKIAGQEAPITNKELIDLLQDRFFSHAGLRIDPGHHHRVFGQFPIAVISVVTLEVISRALPVSRMRMVIVVVVMVTVVVVIVRILMAMVAATRMMA